LPWFLLQRQFEHLPLQEHSSFSEPCGMIAKGLFSGFSGIKRSSPEHGSGFKN
jgi:hypothetical protein